MLMNRIRSPAAVMMLIGVMVVVRPARAEENKPRQAEDKVAIVNGTALEWRDFDGEVLMVQRTVISAGKPLTCDMIASIRKEVLESMVRRELLYQESRKSGIKVDDGVISKEIAGLKKQFPSQTEYGNELARRHLTEDAMRARLEKNFMIQKYIEQQVAGKIVVTDHEMTAYYESHLELFKQPLQARISHILIQMDPNWDESRKQNARKKAERILADLKKGQDFAVLAREQSDGPTRTSGGDLGYVKMGQLDAQLEKAVFKLKPGDLSDIIETNYGYHLFKMTDLKPETILAYDAAKEQIRKHLTEEKAKSDAETYAKNLREKANVEILLQ